MLAIVASGACGLIMVIIGIILVAVAAPNEIPIWYGATMCPCATCTPTPCPASQALLCNPSSATYQNGVVFAGVNLPQSQECRLNPPYAPSELSAQEFTLEKDKFSMDGMTYVPVVYRTEVSSALSFVIVDADNKTLLGGSVETEDSGELIPVPQEDEARVESQEEAAEADSSGRRLMKGGRSAGGPARSRSGASGRWGSGSRAYRTGYGYSSCCVYRSTVVYVHRDGPRTNRGYYDTDEDEYNDCSSEKGCAFEVSDDMSRDELDQFKLVVNNDLKWPLKFRLLEVRSTSYKLDRVPELYITFYTEMLDNSNIAGIILLVIGGIFLLGPCLILFILD